jgi:hypothetical protein
MERNREVCLAQFPSAFLAYDESDDPSVINVPYTPAILLIVSELLPHRDGAHPLRVRLLREGAYYMLRKA